MTEQPVHDALGLLSCRVNGQSTPIVADDPVFAVALKTDHYTLTPAGSSPRRAAGRLFIVVDRAGRGSRPRPTRSALPT
jgi:hypothetical protein